MEGLKALFIGRFQPFHKGHLQVVRRLSRDFEVVVIGIGSAQYGHTKDNPFTGEERKRMLLNSLESERIENYQLVVIKDLHDYPKWVDQVINQVPSFDIVFTNDKLCHELFREKGCRVENIELFNKIEYSGREIRLRIAQDEPWEKLVPEAVKNIINEVDGVTRVKELYSR